jgi:putative Flp pilus-assembly TadE/G-like protein
MRKVIRGDAGQILPLFALVIVALFAMAALLFDAAQALVSRRQLQDATDAAALAAANVIPSGTPRGCSATGGPPPGTPRDVVVNAARASLTANVGAALSAAAIITCPNAWNNGGVRIDLSTTSTAFFARILGRTGFDVSTRSTAVNTLAPGHGYSVITLNPYNAAWQNSLKGCPSFLFNGSPTVTSYGSIHINSACPAGQGYALSRSGNSSTVTMLNGSFVEVVGAVDPGAMMISPPPITGAQYLPDPLAALPVPNVAALPVRSASRLILNNTVRTLDPGIYVGGLELRNRSQAYLHPGIYVFQGGGVDLGAQAELYTIGSAFSNATQANWAANCPNDGSCGVLMYNMAVAGTMGQFHTTAGTVFLVRGYQYGYSGPAANNDFKGILLWQARDPAPTSVYVQPEVQLQGGASVAISGTIYAASAPVQLAGGSGGGGGFDIDYHLQFICWDIRFSGTSDWRLQYNDLYFYQPPDYGLVE